MSPGATSPVTVLVTGVGGGGYGEQIVKALRLAPTDYRIVGTDITVHSLGFATVDEAVVLPSARETSYVGALLEACARHRVSAVLPGSEAELLVLSAERDAIEAAGLFLPVNPAAVIDTCMNKMATVEWLTGAGFAVPRTRLVTTEADVATIDFSPAVVKPVVGGGGSAHVMLGQSVDEVRTLSHYLLRNVGDHVVQEYVGTVDSEFTVGVLMDMDGQLVDSIAVRRSIMSGLSNRLKVANRTGNPAYGSTLAISSGVSQGQVGRFPEVTTECEHIARELGARGAVNIQCRLVGSEVLVFEINPRFSGTTSIRAMVGYNEPDWLIRRHVLGEDLGFRISYTEALVLRGLVEQVVDDRFVR
jgi:carbamoyl-phosphate synthase large subunit